MIYINYLSKVRSKVNMTEEELQKEIARNNGKVATKTLPGISRIKVDSNKEKILHNLEVMMIDFTTNYGDTSSLYKTFQIPKRSGGMREICAPVSILKDMQSKILEEFSKKLKFLPHNAAHGFTKKRNCKTSLDVHRAHKSRWFLKLDIKDFFPNTTEEVLRKAIKTVYPFCMMSQRAVDLLIKICTLNGATPQGAPTSPLLTNMVMVEKDVAITKYCREHDLVYTRYADDILISSRVDFDWKDVQAHVQELLGEYQVKEEKTRYGSFNGRNWNLGLMYNNDYKITVGHKKKQLVKNMLHNYNTKEEQHTIENWYKLIGIVGYCNYIEPQYFSKYLEELKANKPA